ncbi:MAG: GNAT family N-acetyltransferase [Gammaproteobacteria bacterium]|nr:GNAT family N-acetyltransferase [Gammaproteobacteria bacterium]MDH5653958.1 GNAT family N-acetyltransferase [Gammaproteobacteria bacterium]
MEPTQLKSRAITEQDCKIICRFPLNMEELFNLAPNARFPWTAAQMLQTLPDRLANTAFTIDVDIVGFANFYNYEQGNQTFIGNVVVNPLYRGQGIGKAIIRQMLEIGFSQYRFKVIHVSCFSTNTRGLLMYKKLGFLPYGIEQRTNHANEPVALINMQHSHESFLDYCRTRHIPVSDFTAQN